jgi:hypothetical protein
MRLSRQPLADRCRSPCLCPHSHYSPTTQVTVEVTGLDGLGAVAAFKCFSSFADIAHVSARPARLPNIMKSLMLDTDPVALAFKLDGSGFIRMDVILPMAIITEPPDSDGLYTPVDGLLEIEVPTESV